MVVITFRHLNNLLTPRGGCGRARTKRRSGYGFSPHALVCLPATTRFCDCHVTEGSGDSNRSYKEKWQPHQRKFVQHHSNGQGRWKKSFARHLRSSLSCGTVIAPIIVSEISGLQLRKLWAACFTFPVSILQSLMFYIIWPSVLEGIGDLIHT